VNDISEVKEIRKVPRHDCPLCGTSGDVLYNGLTDSLYDVPGEWDLRKCQSRECGLVWLDPVPDARDIGKIYEDYSTHHDIRKGGRNLGLFAKIIRWNARTAFSILKKLSGLNRARKAIELMYLGDVPRGKLLEVGCGAGQGILQMKRAGWDPEGQEIDPSAAKRARDLTGVTVHVGVLNDLALKEDTYDAIVMNHVIEHLIDPVALLKECLRLLKPGGVLVATTPNVESYGLRYFREKWRGLEVPRHMQLFNTETLGTVAKKAGCRVADVWTTPARAQSIMTGSLNIQRSGKHTFGAYPGLRVELEAMLMQMWSLAVYRSDPLSGEECVLKAWKG